MEILELVSILKNHFQDEGLDEIFFNGTRHVYGQYRHGGVVPLPPVFNDDGTMIRSLQIFAASRQVRLDPLMPAGGGDWIVQDHETTYFRWHALLPPASRHGATFCVRRHRFGCLKPDDFGGDPKLLLTLREAVKESPNLILCGATGSGKTSLLTALLKDICFNERVVILEPLTEIPLLSPTWVSLAAVPPNIEGKGGFRLEQGLEESLRLRPDRIVVGEVRGVEAAALLKLLSVGHNGIMTTLHADSPEAALKRLSQASGCPELAWRSSFDQNKSFFVFVERGNPPWVRGIFDWRNHRWL